MVFMDHIVYWLTEYRYLILFPLAIIEGPILAIIAGFLAMRGYFNLWIVLPVIVAGDLISDSLCFLLGRKGLPTKLKAFIYWSGFNRNQIRRAKVFVESHPKSFIPLSKITLGIGVLGIYLTGNSGVPYRKFISICLATSVCQYVIYLEIGVVFGHAYARISRYLDYTASFFIIVLLTCILIYIIQTISRKL